MIGKKNVVFGFLYLVLTAVLGILMVNMYEDFGKAALEKQASVGRLQQLKENGFEEELEPLNAKQIAMANTDGILSLNKLGNTEMSIDSVKGGPHAHGNLEARVEISSNDELGELAETFNYMADTLTERDQRLKEYARKKMMESERLVLIGQLAEFA